MNLILLTLKQSPFCARYKNAEGCKITTGCNSVEMKTSETGMGTAM